ncbi:MAG: stage III sporulation protein AB [Bacillota bacterium]
MLKTLGAVMVLASGSLCGNAVGGLYSRRPRELKAMMGALLLLKTEIGCIAAPLGEAFAAVARRADQRVAPFFDRAGAHINSTGGLTAAEAWERAVIEASPSSALREEDLDILRDLSAALGNSDRENQAQHVSLAIERLKAAAVLAEEDAGRYVRLYKFLGFGTGLSLVVLLC